MYHPASDRNHLQRLETLTEAERQFVPVVIAQWNSAADQYNQWTDLGWDERDGLLRTHRAVN